MSERLHAGAALFSGSQQRDCSVGSANGFSPFTIVEQSIPERFEYQTSNYPDRIAVKSRKYTFTYAALNSYANRISRAILALRGIGDETIGLILEKEAPMFAAFFGVLKAGKIHVALDPTHPRARTAQILEDAEVSLIITDDKNVASALELAHRTRQVLNIDHINSSVSERNPVLSIAPEALACIVYTSGSTGSPKGVIQTHRNVLHKIKRYTNNLRISKDDRLTLLSSCCTGFTISDTYSALLNGATLYPFDVKEEGFHRLAAWLRREEITVFHTTASLFRYFLSSARNSELYPSVRLVWLSGERLYKKDAELFKLHFSPTCILVNSFASTEAGTVRHFVIDKQTPIAGGVVPVGFAVDDMEVLLLDEAGHPVGFDSPGEIAIKSAHLFPGYWRRPELTREVLLPDPDGGNARIFRTGDMGRMTPDGCLEYLGRRDSQVKIRGFRVELADVEAALLELDQVNQVAIVAKENSIGEQHLVAYVVMARKKRAITSEELRLLVQQKLPEYMLPAQFVFLDELPMTASGKVNLRALASSEPARSETPRTVLVPRDYIELELTKIFTSLLGVRWIGLRDNLFDLGLHSLLAVQLVSQIEKQFGRSFPASITLEAPTIEKLAKLLQHQKSSTSSFVSVQTEGSKPSLFCVPGVGGNAFSVADLSRALGPDQPFYALQSVGLYGTQAPFDTIEKIARCYLSEIRKVQPHGPYVLIGACFGATVAYEMTCQLLATGDEVAFLGLLDPIRRGGTKVSKPTACKLYGFKRAQALSSFLMTRLRLHLHEMRALSNTDRTRYVAGKLRAVCDLIARSDRLREIQRELKNIEVDRANRLAHRCYEHKALNGRLQTAAIFETANREQEPFNWRGLWEGVTTRHVVPGIDSGDAMCGENVRVLADVLTERLRAAYEELTTADLASAIIQRP